MVLVENRALTLMELTATLDGIWLQVLAWFYSVLLKNFDGNYPTGFVVCVNRHLGWRGWIVQRVYWLG